MSATLYETDYYLWARRQAEALRQLDRERWNGPLDLKELAEEVDDLAKRDRNACRSQVVRIVVHLLKLDHSPAVEPRSDWKVSVLSARRELRADLTPTLERDLRENFEGLYRASVEEAALALERYLEKDAAASLPATSPYDLGDVLRDGFYGFKEEQARQARTSSASAGS
jgi:hypothetical protein